MNNEPSYTHTHTHTHTITPRHRLHLGTMSVASGWPTCYLLRIIRELHCSPSYNAHGIPVMRLMHACF